MVGQSEAEVHCKFKKNKKNMHGKILANRQKCTQLIIGFLTSCKLHKVTPGERERERMFIELDHRVRETDRLTETRENTGKLCFAITSLTCSRSPASLGVRRGGAGDP